MDASRHLLPETIERFSAMALSERRAFVRHVRECRRCSAEAVRVWRLDGSVPRLQPPVDTFNLQTVLSRVADVEAALAWEREQAPELFREIEKHPSARRQTIVRNSRRFWQWGFAELLIAKSKDAVFHEPASALELAELALDTALRLPESNYGATLLSDFRGKTLMALGNARRVMSDLRGAEAALAEAETCLRQGSGDPIAMAHLHYHHGSLNAAQRRFPESIRAFDRAVGACRRLGDKHLEGRALIGKATAYAKKGDLEESIRLQEIAMPLIDAEREPRVLLAAQHNLLMDLVDIGRAAEALVTLEFLRPMYSRLGERQNLLRLRWLEARAAQAVGDFPRAEQAYLEIKEAFAAEGIPYDSAVASLELATLYAEQGRTSEIKQLALQMLPVFQALEIQRETVAALILFRQAAEAETASLALIQHIAGFLKRAQHDPAARFSPPS
jgi:tetratricopeptide (TPR) repeat protein